MRAMRLRYSVSYEAFFIADSISASALAFKPVSLRTCTPL
jgi:hypothetical protein